jgi:lipopolysaccharide transport system permease protein
MSQKDVASLRSSIAICPKILTTDSLADYLPYLGTGLVVWMFIAAFLTEGCATFTAAEGAIKQVAVPLSTHAFRTVWRNLIIFAHHLVILMVLVIVFPVAIGWSALLAIPGLLIVCLFGFALTLALGVLSTRFRDIPIVIANLVQLVFFTTPILWRADALPLDRQFIVAVNPFHYLISIVRDPILGTPPPLWLWGMAIACTVVALGVAFGLFAMYRSRIAYWL